MDKHIQHQIDSILKYIWMYDIKRDYDCGYLLKEDTLKNALYFHLRTKLSALMEKYHLRIYTEFTDDLLKGTKRVPDLVVVKADPDSPYVWGDAVTEIVLIMEIKYKYGRGASVDAIANDFEKIKWYTENLDSDCLYYMATIWEENDEDTSWIRKNAAWAKGKLTELNASYEKDQMRFYITEHV